MTAKIAVVTGASSGIGAAIAAKLHARSYTVVNADLVAPPSDRSGASTSHFLETNLSSPRAIRQLVHRTVEEVGIPEILVNNAGATCTRLRIEDMSSNEWDAAQNLLLRAPVLAIAGFAPLMAANGGGSIVNIASIAGYEPGAAPAAYSVAKAGVLHLTRIAAAELAQQGIRVNSVSPGLINTSIFTADSSSADRSGEITELLEKLGPRAQPVARSGEPEDIANCAVFLATQDASFVTGVDLVVDGGLTIGPRHSWDRTMNSPYQRLLSGER